MQKINIFSKLPLVISIWFWVLMPLMHFTYPDPITAELGFSYFGLAETPAGHANMLTAVLFAVTLSGLMIGLLLMAFFVFPYSKPYAIIHIIAALGSVCVMFPFDRYKSIHDIGAQLVYFSFLLIAIRISMHAFRHEYKKLVEATMLSITTFMTIVIIIFIGFFVAIEMYGGILQKVYLMLFFIIYAGFQPKDLAKDAESKPL